MGRFLSVMLCCLRLTCPACRRGRMFRSYFKMNVRCPVCGVIFERDPGEVTGGIAINSLLTAILVVCGAGLAFFTDVPIVPLLVVLIIVTITFPLWFYRRARSLWVGMLYITGAMEEN